MTTSSNGNIFRVTGCLWGEYTGHRWIPHTKTSDAELWYFLRSTPEQTVKQTTRRQGFETLSRSWWHHCNEHRGCWCVILVVHRKFVSQCHFHGLLISGSEFVVIFIQGIGSASVQIMACSLFDIKPLSIPMLGYCYLGNKKQNSVKV